MDEEWMRRMDDVIFCVVDCGMEPARHFLI
jgi:hypothetical protein